MTNATQHALTLRREYPSGAEEWYCAECGRTLLLQWPPNFKRIVLVAGEEQVAHAASVGGLKIGGAEISQVEDDEPYLSDEILNALNDLDFDQED